MSSRKLTSPARQRTGVERVPPESRRVVRGDQAGRQPRPVVGRRHDHPAGLGLERAAADRHRGQHGPVADVVGPPVVVGERRQRGLARGVALPVGRQEHQAPELVGEQLAQRHRLAHGTARRRGHRRSAAGPLIVRSPEATTSPSRSAPVTSALRRFTGCGDGDVHRGVEVVPGRLLVGDADRPGDRGVGGGELTDHLTVGVVAVDAEAGRLAGDGPAGVLEAVGRNGQGARELGTEEEAVGAVADPGDADRGVDGDGARCVRGRRRSPAPARPTDLPGAAARRRHRH